MASIGLGLILLMGVYALPVQPIKAHVFDSTAILESEGTYTEFLPQWFVRMHPDNINLHTMVFNNRGMARDNHTDSLMLGAAAYDDNQTTSVVQKALLVYHDEVVPDAPYNSLLAYSQTGTVTALVAYPRYWHGYLVILKPLLFVLSYTGVRYFNVIALLILLLFLIRGIWIRIGKKETAAFAVALLFAFPIVIPYCMQYCTMTYIMLIASNVMVYAGDTIWKRQHMIYYWLLLGICTAYFDFLTYPVLALGVALVLQELVLKKTSGKMIICSVFFWLAGYGGMWSSKWVLADLLTDQHVIRDALNQIVHRTVGESDFVGRKANAITAIGANLSCYTNIVFLIFLLVTLGWFIWNLVKNRKQNGSVNYHLIVIAIIPFAWYALTASHSFDHSSYTYRAIMASVFAMLCFSIGVKSNDGSNGHCADKE